MTEVKSEVKLVRIMRDVRGIVYKPKLDEHKNLLIPLSAERPDLPPIVYYLEIPRELIAKMVDDSDSETTMIGVSDEHIEWYRKPMWCRNCGSEFMVSNPDGEPTTMIKCCPVCGKRVSGTMTENGNEEIYDFRKG